MRSSVIYFCGALGGLLFGYNTGIISGALHFLGEDLQIVENSLEEGLVTAAVLVGAAIGAFAVGKLADSIGRKNSLFVSSIIFIIGAILSGVAPSIVILIVARIVLGFAVGAVSALVPMYLSEIATTARRGSIAFINQLMIVVGILLAYIVNWLFVEFGDKDWNVQMGWRVALCVAVVPALVLFIAAFILPESPRFLVFVGDIKGAKSVLNKLRRENSEIDDEIADISKNITARTGTIKELFSRFARPALVAAIGLAFFQQAAGINTMIYYAPKLLEVVGLNDSDQRLATVLLGVTNVVATLIAILVVDRINRRTLLTIGGVVMGAALFVMAFIENSGFIAENPTAAGVYSVMFMMIYMIAFGITWGGVMWIVLAEIFPIHIRGIGVGFAGAINWIANFAVITLFPALMGHSANEEDCFSECGQSTMFGGSPFWLYIAMGIFALGGVVFVRFKLFETRGKSLEEIETELNLKVMNIEQ